MFDQSIGQIFVTRVAGNLTSSEFIASLEYGAAALGTQVILVLGHGDCGAVEAAVAGKAVPGRSVNFFALIRPAVEASGGDLEITLND